MNRLENRGGREMFEGREGGSLRDLIADRLEERAALRDLLKNRFERRSASAILSGTGLQAATIFATCFPIV